MTRKIRRKDLELYVELAALVLYIVVMITGLLTSAKLIKPYWHGSAVFYLTMFVGFHLFLNGKKLLQSIEDKLRQKDPR